MKCVSAVPAFAALIFAAMMMTGCEYTALFFGEYTPPETALLMAKIPLVEEYAGSMARMDLIIVDRTTDELTTLSMKSNTLNNLALIDEFELENGDYSAYVILEKEWDDENGCSLYCQTPAKEFNFEGRNLELAFDNPWITKTQRVVFNVDVGTMMDAGASPEFTGLWLRSVRENELDKDYHYHFHTKALEGQTLSGSFDIQAGSYTIDVIPENFDHPDWDTSVDPWYDTLSAGNIEHDYYISISDSELDIETTHFIEFDFEGSEKFFIEERNGGTIDYADSAVHLEAAGADAVPFLVLTDDISLTDNTLLSFELKLGAHDSELNGSEPYVHINMLTDTEADTRTFVTLDSAGYHFHSLLEGVDAGSETWNPAGVDLNDGNYHVFYLFIKNSKIYLYESLSSAPLYVYEYADGIPGAGGFSFESHQEVFIRSLRMERELFGGLDLTEL